MGRNPVVSLRDGERLSDYAIRVTAELDEVREELARIKKFDMHWCACAADEVFRDRALALLRRCKEWFDEGPENDRPEPLSAEIDALLEEDQR